jgi:predicted glycosyltransferase involved in capsule biosynthesis
MKKLCIVVPYRDREEHLNKFTPHMKKYMEKNEDVDYEIIIVEQADTKPFNRAKLLNIGFLENRESDYFIFHDVDMLPEDSDYCYEENPTHLSSMVEQFGYKLPYDGYFGGVTLFDKESFEKINGYSNEYWGWGAEDDDVLLRCSTMGIPIFRKSCKYRSLSHDRKIEQIPYNRNLNKLNNFSANPTQEKIMSDGLSTIKYERISEKSISDSVRIISVNL